MYTVILRSDSPLAKPMQKWVTSEILPAIRKSGGYMAAKVDETPEEIMARALVVAQDTINRQKQRVQMLEGEREHLSAEVKQLAPKAEYTDEVLQSTSTYTFTQMSKELNLRSVYVLEDRLKQAGVIFKQSGQWMLTCKYAGKGYTATRTARYFHDDGTPGTSTSTVWTERGRAFLHQLGKGGAL
jgi:phage antirepressor YoqD-like protein